MKSKKQGALLPWLRLLIAALFLFAVAGIASAGATFNNFTGPTWLNPGYRWTVDASLTNPDKQVCIEYSVNGGALTASQCSCAGAGCPDVGAWTCTIPSNFPSSSIAWRVGSWTAGGGGSCGAEQNLAGSGTTTTGPNAVALSRFDVARSDAGWQMAVIALLGLVGLGGGLWWARKGGAGV